MNTHQKHFYFVYLQQADILRAIYNNYKLIKLNHSIPNIFPFEKLCKK